MEKETEILEQNMHRLKELTKEIFEFSETAHKTNGRIDFDWEKGGGFGIGLYNTEYASALVGYVESGSIHQSHYHYEKEVVIVIKGEMESHIGGEVRCLSTGDILEIAPKEIHRMIYTEKEDSIVLAITIPQCQDFPNVSKK